MDKQNLEFNPLAPSAHKSARIAKISIPKIRRDHKKNYLWASRLWVGRRKEPILGYVPKTTIKRIQAVKG